MYLPLAFYVFDFYFFVLFWFFIFLFFFFCVALTLSLCYVKKEVVRKQRQLLEDVCALFLSWLFRRPSPSVDGFGLPALQTLKQDRHFLWCVSFVVDKNHISLLHTLSLHRRPPPSADGSGLFQDICQWLYKLGYTFFFFIFNIYVYLYLFKNSQLECICLVIRLYTVLYCFFCHIFAYKIIFCAYVTIYMNTIGLCIFLYI